MCSIVFRYQYLPVSFFRPAGHDPEVVFETSTSERGAPTDSAPMTFKKLMNDLERQGVLDLTVAGHKLSRPSGVLRGDEPDRHSSVLNLFSGGVCNMHDTSMPWQSRFISCTWQVRDRPRVFFRLSSKPRPSEQSEVYKLG